MKEIVYHVTYGNGTTEAILVRARTINSGFNKALREAKEPLGSGRVREIARIEFWEVQ